MGECEKNIEQVRGDFKSYMKTQEMQMLSLNNTYAQLQTELDKCLKTRQELYHDAEEATHEDSEHSLHFGQILMSVENLYLRCIDKRKGIHHSDQMNEVHKEEDEDEDSFQYKQRNAVAQLKVIMAYLKDFKDMVDTLKKPGHSIKKQRQDDHAKPPEPKIEIRQEMHANAADRGSQNSGSQGNTKELQPGTAGASASINRSGD